ncbi:MAG TPA: glycosyltransferase family 2 protein [Limnochordales bacterium]
MPAWQEASRVGKTVAALRRLDQVAEVVVVDDGSSDATAQAAAQSGARVIRLPRRRGKGAALLRGVQAAGQRWVLLCDADLEESAAVLGTLCAVVATGQADMAVAVPQASTGRGLGLVRAVAGLGVRWLGGARLAAPLSGQRALSRELALRLMGGPPCGFGVEVRMGVRALRWGVRVAEVALPVTHRSTGWRAPDVLHRGIQLWDVGRTLARLFAEAAREGRG